MEQRFLAEDVEASAHGASQSPVLDRLYCDDRSSRLEAQREVLNGRTVDTSELIAILERENKKKKARFIVGFILGYLPIVVLANLIHMGAMAGSFSMAGIAAGAWFAPTRLQKFAARKLAETEDVRTVGPLAEALDKQDAGTKRVATDALIRLLPKMKYSDRDLINDRQRKFLYAGFGDRGIEYTRALLHALEQIGDGKAVKYVARYAEGKGTAKKHPDLVEEANRLLPILEERAEQEMARDRLLRAAGPTEVNTDELLRPASASSDTNSELLLRPAG